jgi:platelet-activating factor acetylhydrolase IB subunit alpha
MSNTSEGVENGETKGGDNVAQKQVTPTRTSGGQFVVTGSRDRTVRVWHVLTGSCICVFSDHENWVRNVQFHPSGHVVIAVSEDRTIRAFDLKEGRKSVRTINDAHSHFITSFDMTGTTMVTGSVDKTLKSWPLK